MRTRMSEPHRDGHGRSPLAAASITSATEPMEDSGNESSETYTFEELGRRIESLAACESRAGCGEPDAVRDGSRGGHVSGSDAGDRPCRPDLSRHLGRTAGRALP